MHLGAPTIWCFLTAHHQRLKILDLSFWALLVMKMLASAAIVVGASLVVERSGPFLGAMIVTLPISAGPAYVFLAVDHGAAFIKASALAGLPVSAATVIYMVVYAAVAQRFGVLSSVGSALGVWAIAITVILKGQWSLGSALALNVAVYALAIPLTRKFSTAVVPVAPKKRAWDVPFRAALLSRAATFRCTGRTFLQSLQAVSQDRSSYPCAH